MTRKAHTAEVEPRPAEHNHEYDGGEFPVLVLDLHGTLTPCAGFPLTEAPFDGVREFLDRMAARGCCNHISTASLHETGDPQVYDARLAQVEAYCERYSLPIEFIGPNTEADARLDDRMVPIPPKPDWSEIAAQAEARLLETFELVNGKYQRRTDLEPVGEEIEFPAAEADADQPRGYTTPRIDIDIHRTLNPAWGSAREAPADPAGVAMVNQFYDEGFQVQLSCPGWNPATRPETSAQRLTAMQRYAREYGVRYDRIVAKDDSDLHFDDKGIRFTGDWKLAEAQIRARLTSQGLGKPIPKAAIGPEVVKVSTGTPRLKVRNGAIRQSAYAFPNKRSVQIEYSPTGKPIAIRRA